MANITVATLQSGDIGIGFGGAGFLIFYYIGILEVLSQLGIVTPATKLAGSSSGALITTSHCAGVATKDVYKFGLDLAHFCRSHVSCTGSLDKQVRKVLQDSLPQDAHQRCYNKGFIAITTGRLLTNEHHPLLIGDYKSQEELISAAASSSFIPLWSAGTMATQFRGLQVYDGGFASRQPCPPGVKVCIRVSTSNPQWPRRTGVESFMTRVAVRGPQVMFAPDPTIRSYPPLTSTGSDGPDPAMLKLAASKGVDIAPGIYHKLPFSQDELNEWALSPADDGTLNFMYKLGKADAEAWAKYSGWATKSTTGARSSSGKRGVAPGRKLMAAS